MKWSRRLFLFVRIINVYLINKDMIQLEIIKRINRNSVIRSFKLFLLSFLNKQGFKVTFMDEEERTRLGECKGRGDQHKSHGEDKRQEAEKKRKMNGFEEEEEGMKRKKEQKCLQQ